MLFMTGINKRADFLLSPMRLSLSSCQFLCTMKTYTTQAIRILQAQVEDMREPSVFSIGFWTLGLWTLYS